MRRHWYSKPEPLAVTENDTGAPGLAEMETGPTVISGSNTLVRLSVAGAEVALPTALVTTRSYEPTLANCTARSTRLALVAPTMATPALRH